MKKCPYCAEEIQDEAIKCRYCFSDLTAPRDVALQQRPGAPAGSPAMAGTADPPGATAAASPAGSPAPDAPSPATIAAPGEATGPAQPAGATMASGDAGEIRYTHSGYRYVLGYGPDYFGLWDRQSPTTATERWPRSDEGWRAAWVRFVALEPKHVSVPGDGSATEPAAATVDAGDDDVQRYTHTGQRYLLGYGESFFGIWDREKPEAPIERFPRTDDGWEAAWRRYTQIESNFAEVPAGDATASGGAGTGS